MLWINLNKVYFYNNININNESLYQVFTYKMKSYIDDTITERNKANDDTITEMN